MKLFQKLITVFCVVLLCWVDLSTALASDLLETAGKTVEALKYVKNEINNRYQTYLNAESSIADLIEELKPIEAKANNLREQLQTLDENIRRANLNISAVQEELKGTQLQIADIAELSEMRQVELGRSQQLLNEFIRLAYQETVKYTDWETGEISTLKFLLHSESLSGLEIRQTYLTVLQNTTLDLINDLNAKQAEYDKTNSELLIKRGQLILIQQELINKTNELKENQAAKQKLLLETSGQEKIYQELVNTTRRQQAESLMDIEELQKQLGVVDSRLASLKNQLGEDNFQELLKKQSVNGLSGLSFPGRIPRLSWPAMPSGGITAYFHDPSYVPIFNVIHQAIDFRLSQGMPVTAAAPGIIYKAKDNGYGYSYIMLVHPGDLTTVYGHISKILVQEGETIKAGEVIGLSGGTPGSLGAGYMTTGPHMHFEVLDKGVHVDPLDYLPLEQLPVSDIPVKYLKEAKKIQ